MDARTEQGQVSIGIRREREREQRGRGSAEQFSSWICKQAGGRGGTRTRSVSSRATVGGIGTGTLGRGDGREPLGVFKFVRREHVGRRGTVASGRLGGWPVGSRDLARNDLEDRWSDQCRCTVSCCTARELLERSTDRSED